MKKAVIFVVLAMVVIGYCAAQSANDAQRIVGTWVTEDGRYTFVFNANGTGTLNGDNIFYGISAGGKIGIQRSKISSNVDFYDLFISPDGKRIMIGNSYILQKK